jgi:hypothetical protein
VGLIVLGIINITIREFGKQCFCLVHIYYNIWCRDQDGNFDSLSGALPETFSDGDIVLWLRKFELCSTTNDWKDTDMLKRLPTLLSGKAFTVFERLSCP